MRARLYAWSLHSISSIFLLFFRREGFDLEGLSLRERNFDLRERLDVKAHGGRLGGLGRRVDKSFEMIRVQFIEKTHPLHLKSNFDLDFLLGLHLGIDLIQLDL